MKIQDGRLIFEIKPCSSCHGTGKQSTSRACARDGQAQRGKPCELCKATTKRHAYIDGPTVACTWCDGTLSVQEKRGDFLPTELWQQLAFKVYRNHCTPENGESVYTSTDYGEAFKSTDASVIERVRASTSHQARVCRDDGTLLTIGVFVAKHGYSVVAIDGEPKERPVISDADRPRIFGETIEKQVKAMQGETVRWRKETGQWLVYGMESLIGFDKGVELCGAIESAWKDKAPIAPVAEALYVAWKGGAK